MIFSADRFGQYVVTRQKELNHKGSYETNFGGGGKGKEWTWRCLAQEAEEQVAGVFLASQHTVKP